MPMNDTPGTRTGEGGLKHTIQQQASSALSVQKNRAADGMTAVIEAVRQAGNQLRDKNGTLAGYADTAAGQLERWSSQLRDRDVSELMDDVSAFARRRPVLFVGSGVAIGLVAARFLKSSAPNRSSSWDAEQPAQRFTTSGSMSSAGMGSMSSTDVGGMATDVAADRPLSRTPRSPRSRARSVDER